MKRYENLKKSERSSKMPWLLSEIFALPIATVGEICDSDRVLQLGSELTENGMKMIAKITEKSSSKQMFRYMKINLIVFDICTKYVSNSYGSVVVLASAEYASSSSKLIAPPPVEDIDQPVTSTLSSP